MASFNADRSLQRIEGCQAFVRCQHIHVGDGHKIDGVDALDENEGNPKTYRANNRFTNCRYTMWSYNYVD